MPDVPRLTVTLAVVALDNVAVNVREPPEFSEVVVALVDKVTVGADSFSVIVIVSCWVPFSVAPPPDTLDISSIAVSSPSYIASSVGVKVVVPVELPALIVMSDTAA